MIDPRLLKVKILVLPGVCSMEFFPQSSLSLGKAFRAEHDAYQHNTKGRKVNKSMYLAGLSLILKVLADSTCVTVDTSRCCLRLI